MVENYTEDVLVRYIYNEADFFEKLEVEHALENDKTVRSLFEKLVRGYALLPKASFVPSQKTVDQILFASRETAFHV